MFMPIMLISQMEKHCNHVVNSPDENNIIGVVYNTWQKLVKGMHVACYSSGTLKI